MSKQINEIKEQCKDLALESSISLVLCIFKIMRIYILSLNKLVVILNRKVFLIYCHEIDHLGTCALSTLSFQVPLEYHHRYLYRCALNWRISDRILNF